MASNCTWSGLETPPWDASAQPLPWDRSYQLRCYAIAREERTSWHTHAHLADPPSCSVGPLRRKEKRLVTSSSKDLSSLPLGYVPVHNFKWKREHPLCVGGQLQLPLQQNATRSYPPVSPRAPALALAGTDADFRDLSSAYLQASASAS